MSAAADAVLNRLRGEWAAEKARMIDAVNYAAATKTGLPDHYWQAEHDAYLKVKVAAALAVEMWDLP
jgi:hypothetical protein